MRASKLVSESEIFTYRRLTKVHTGPCLVVVVRFLTTAWIHRDARMIGRDLMLMLMLVESGADSFEFTKYHGEKVPDGCRLRTLEVEACSIFST